MAITTTGIAFSLSAIGLAFCGIRFFEAFQKMGGLRSGNRTGILLSMFYLGLSLQHAILAIGALFFSKFSEALYIFLIVDHVILSIVTALGMYLTFYIFSPKFSPWPATIVIFLFGIFVAGLIAITHPLPFVTATSSVDWNMSYQLNIWAYYLLIINIGLPFIIFSKNFFLAKTKEVKNVSLIIMIIQFLGIINVSILFTKIFIKNEVKNQIFDIVLVVIGLLFIGAFLLTPVVIGWKAKILRDRS